MEDLKKSFLVRGDNIIGALGDKNFSTAPLGTVLSFAGQTAPHGYLLCDGASYKVADYPHLYAVIGNIYGGDSTNFNVPNLVDKFIQGSTASGTEKEAGLPNITGKTYNMLSSSSYEEGALSNPESTNTVNTGGSSTTKYRWLYLDASKSNTIYGNSDTVQPPALTMVYIIKAFHTNEGVDSGVSDDVIEYVDNKVATKKDAVKLLNNATDSTKWLKLKLGTSATFQPIIISDQYGGKVEITGMADTGTYKSVKLVRYSYGDWSTYSATDYTLYNGVDPNYKIQRLYYYPTDGYYYLEIRQWATIKIEGNSTAELVTDLPAEKSEMTLIPESRFASKKDVDGVTIQTTTTTTDNEYYAITYGDDYNDPANQNILIQYKRSNFPPSTYIFSAVSYATDTRETVSVAKISNNFAGTTYDLRFYIDKDNKTVYLRMPSYSSVSLQNLAFKSKAVTYTKVDAIPSTATALTVTEYASKSEAEKKKQVMRLPFTVSDNKFNVKYSDVLALIDKYCNFEDSGVKQNAYIPLYLTCYTSNNNTLLSCFAKFEGGIYLDRVMSSSNESPAKITRESEVNSISIELGGNPTSLFVTL